MNKIICLILICIILAGAGLSVADTGTVENETQNETLNETQGDAQNETGNVTGEKKISITINDIEIIIDNTGLVHLKERMIIPTYDNEGEISIPGDILIPADAKNSLSIFYELGTRKLDFKQDKESITIFFPDSAKPGESQVITVSYTTYRFVSTSAGVGKLEFFEFPVTPDITKITIKFPEGSGIIPVSVPGSTSTISGSELEVRPDVGLFNLTYRYYLPPPIIPDDNKSKDLEPPVVTLKSPGNNATLEQGNITFKYFAEDASGIKNCELIINSEARGVTEEVFTGDNEFTINLGAGEYIWTVRCADNSENENSKIASPVTLIILPAKEPADWWELIFNNLKTEYGISLILALVLVTYLLIAYLKRSKKQETKKEPGLEDLYPEKEVPAEEETKQINLSIMKLLDDNEKKIIDILKTGETTQANIYKITQIPKATLSNIMRKLEERNLIVRRAEGKVKWVKLKDWVFE
ncbi:hypothetical protein BEH94_09745 [Candidatus Altiarchaeales archaeon WOR_SM1_SCG]|nr:hypothetical protein BEH94_09745 [Candidatus Altiarchaeales archaeon WOR_SM1_SCG]